MKMTAYDPDVGKVQCNPTSATFILSNGTMFRIEETTPGVLGLVAEKELSIKAPMPYALFLETLDVSA